MVEELHPAHQSIKDNMSTWDRRADKLASFVGSWKFLGIQSIVITIWIALNLIGIFGLKWDPYPFILLNLVFSTQAAYAAPIIQLSSNRQSAVDREQATLDYQINQSALKTIEADKALTEAIHEMIQELRSPNPPGGNQVK